VPLQWPAPQGAPSAARLFANGGFFTKDGRARFVASEMPLLRSETTAARPLRLSTGRIRDQWHTMTRTGLSQRLGAHLPEPFVEIHPDDASRYGVVHQGFARVTTDYGHAIVRVVVSNRQQRGMLFAPIHWSAVNSSHGRIGALAQSFNDPFSGQPEVKATPAAITPYEYVFRGFALSRRQLNLPSHLWWTRVAVAGGYGYRFADNADLSRWPAWLSTVADGDVAEYRDFGGGVYRAACFAGERIEACLFVGPARDAGDWEVVKSLFAAEFVTDEQRRLLLSGKSSEGIASTGSVICACFGVGRTTICDAIARGARTTVEIGTNLKAGTNCGSCIPELKRLIAETPSNADAPLVQAAS
jgi:assimilatory nitrate reductase catalytic subunit